MFMLSLILFDCKMLKLDVMSRDGCLFYTNNWTETVMCRFRISIEDGMYMMGLEDLDICAQFNRDDLYQCVFESTYEYSFGMVSY